MPEVKRTTLAELIPHLEERLYTRKVVPRAAILVGIDPSPPHQVSDQDLILRPGGFVIDQRVAYGGGRSTLLMRVKLGVYLRTRGQRDTPDRARAWLLDPKHGHLAREAAAIDALMDFLPEDRNENILLYEPVKVISADDPSPEAKDPEWGRQSFQVQLSYYQAVEPYLDIPEIPEP